MNNAQVRYEQDLILYDKKKAAHWGTFAMVVVSLLYSLCFMYLVVIHIVHPASPLPPWTKNLFINPVTLIVTIAVAIGLMITNMIRHAHLWASVYLVNSSAAFIVLTALDMHLLITGIILAVVARILIGAYVNYRLEK